MDATVSRLSGRLWKYCEAAFVLSCGGVDVNSRDDDGWTPWMHASKQGHMRVARILLGELST